MSREQAVLLVSRAIAVVQFVAALEEITYLPERLMSLHHYKGTNSWLAQSYLTSIQSLELSMLCFRIAGLLVLTWVFWQCSPWLSQLLLADLINNGKAENSSPEAENSFPPK